MKKVLILFTVILCSISVFAEKGNDPDKHWKDNLMFTQKDIKELNEWLNDEETEEIQENIKKQIEIKNEKIEIIKKLLDSKKKDYEGAEIDMHVLNSKENMLHMEIRMLKIKSMNELSESDKDELELLEELVEIQKSIFELQIKEAEVRKKVNKLRKSKRIEELKKELESLGE